MVTYRTSGPWGAGTGANLAPADVDGNFYQLVQMINATAVAGVGIANFVVSGNELWITLTDHTLLGPYTLPVIKFNFVGQWQANTVYPAYTIFTYGGSTYMVLVNITSAATFDPGANDGMGNNYYGLLLSNAPNALPAGGSNGMVLAKAGPLDYGVEWEDPTLAGLFDVQQSPGPTTGQLVYWNGSLFSFISASDIVGAPPALTDLSDVLASPAPTDGQAVVWSASSGKFTYGSGGGGGGSLATLSDVSIATSGPNIPTVGQILSYGGVNDWENLDVIPYQAWNSGNKTLALTDVSNFIDLTNGSAQTLEIPAGLSTTSTIWLRAGATDAVITVQELSGAGVTLLIPVGRIAQTRATGSVIAIRQTSPNSNIWEIDGDLAYAAPTALPTSGTFNLSLGASDSEVYTLTPVGSLTLNCSTVPGVQQRLTIVITTSGVTPDTITFGTGFKSQGTLVTGSVSGAVFTISFISDGVNMNEISRTTAM